MAIIATGSAFAQKTKKKKSRFVVEYFKDHNNKASLVARLLVKEKKYLPLKDVIVMFYSMNDTASVLLDKIRTNEKGEAIFIIEDNPDIFKDSSGIMTFEVEYAGSTSTNGANKKIAVKLASMGVSFFQKESTKYIEVDVNEVGLDEINTPLEGLNVLFFINGTFSQLNFGKEKTDEYGKAKIEFPIDMPGDTLGVLTIIGKIVEHDIYGNIEARGKINWGIPVPLAKEKQRGLGDTDAPLWMVYTLIILLSIVWFNFLYIIFLLAKIKLAK